MARIHAMGKVRKQALAVEGSRHGNITLPCSLFAEDKKVGTLKAFSHYQIVTNGWVPQLFMKMLWPYSKPRDFKLRAHSNRFTYFKDERRRGGNL